MNNAFERIREGLEQAIAHASGEEVEGVVIHQPKTQLKNIRQKTVSIPKQFSSRFKTTEHGVSVL